MIAYCCFSKPFRDGQAFYVKLFMCAPSPLLPPLILSVCRNHVAYYLSIAIA